LAFFLFWQVLHFAKFPSIHHNAFYSITRTHCFYFFIIPSSTSCFMLFQQNGLLAHNV
jgi:hypothetical protein